MTLRISASQVGSLFGCDPYRSRLALWLLLAGKMPPEDQDSEPAEWGRAFEAPVAEMACKRHGLRMANGVPAELAHGELIGHPDRLVLEPDGKLAVLEVKSPWTLTSESANEWGADFSDQVPSRHFLQTATYAMLLGLDIDKRRFGFGSAKAADHAYLAAALPRIGLRLYKIPRTPAIEERIVTTAREFIASIAADQPPDPVTEAECRMRWLAVRGKVHEFTDADAAKAKMRAALKRQIREAEKTVEQLGADILRAMGDASIGTWQGMELVTAASDRVFDPSLVNPNLIREFSRKLDKEALRRAHRKEYDAAMREPRDVIEQKRVLLDRKALTEMIDREEKA